MIKKVRMQLQLTTIKKKLSVSVFHLLVFIFDFTNKGKIMSLLNSYIFPILWMYQQWCQREASFTQIFTQPVIQDKQDQLCDFVYQILTSFPLFKTFGHSLLSS